MEGPKKEFLECEKKWVFRLLILVAGFYGGYTLSCRGGVFCNAQTANMALFAVALGSGNWSRAAYYLIPMSAYLLGIMVSEALPRPLRRLHLLRWDTVLILVEMLVVVLLGFIPATAPHPISQVIVNFVCAMQLNTFRSAEGTPMATTFCTVHLRQFGAGLTAWIRRGKRPSAVTDNGLMLLCFVAGVLSAALTCRVFDVKAIWCALIPLGILFAGLLRADLTTEKDKLEMTPHGH